MFIRINSALRCVGNKANPTSIRRHVASPSRLHLRFLAALWFAPARLRLDYPSPEGDRFYLFPHPASTIFPGSAGLYLLSRSEWCISLCFGWPEAILYCSALFLKSILLSSKARIQIQDKGSASSDFYQVN
jgi:hypothetical protein